MKKSLIILLLATVSLSAFAVDLPKQGFGFQIGYARPTLRLNSSSAYYPKDSLVNVTALNGFKAGVVYDASYIAGFGSSIGVNYTFAAGQTSWGKQNSAQIGEYPRARKTITYHELEVFVDWQYKFEVAKETYLMLYTGPTVQLGLAYNAKTYSQQLPDAEVNYDVYYRMGNNDVDRPNENLNRFNVTWGIGAGFQYQRYFLRGGYDFGLMNPYKNRQFDGSDRYTRGRLDQWSIKIGAYLWYNE